MSVTVYKPIALKAEAVKPFKFAHRSSTLEGKCIGLINTSKVNADLFLKRVEELLLKYGIAGSFYVKKLTPGLPLNPEQLSEINKNTDAALIAFGD